MDRGRQSLKIKFPGPVSEFQILLQLIFILPLVLRLLQDAPLQAPRVRMPLYPWHAHRRLQRALWVGVWSLWGSLHSEKEARDPYSAGWAGRARGMR